MGIALNPNQTDGTLNPNNSGGILSPNHSRRSSRLRMGLTLNHSIKIIDFAGGVLARKASAFPFKHG